MTMVLFALFFLTFLAILGGTHAFVAFSTAHFFSIVAPASRYMLVGVTVFLSASFFLTSLLVHWKDMPLSRFLYSLSGFWLGLLVYLLLASLLIWFCVLLWPRMGQGAFPAGRWAGILFALAWVVTLLGAWNAFHPVVKEISVRIPGLPEAWRGKRVVQLSDVHLGHTYRQDFLRGVVAQVNALQPSMVMITGDLFDGMNNQLDALAAPLADLQTEKGVYYITGNHETYAGVELVREALSATSMRFLEDEVVDVDGLSLIGIGYPERRETKDMAALLRTLQPSFLGKPNILLFHAPTHLEVFRAAGVNLQLSGHTHRGQQFPFNWVTYLMYRGHDYGLYQNGDYALYTTNGVGTWGPPVRVGNRPEIVMITLE